MKRQLMFTIFLIVFLPALVLADSADDDWWDDDYDDDDEPVYNCINLCLHATTLCNTPCLPSTYDECFTFCADNLDQHEIECRQHYSCSSFNLCLCDTDDDSDDDDATADDDDDAQTNDDVGDNDDDNLNDEASDGDSGDDDNDDDNGLFCSVTRGEQSAALTIFMLAVGIIAFICSLSSSRKSQ